MGIPSLTFYFFVFYIQIGAIVTPLSVNKTTDSYEFFCVGNCQQDAITNTRGGTILMGGSRDVDQAFLWLIGNSGGGDILVLRASGSDGYNDYIYNLGRVNSVSSIVCTSKDASSDPFVLEKIKNSEGLFFAGGDQWLYYSYWKNTPVEDAVNYLVAEKRVTIGGTSAGMAILTDIVFTAEFDTVTSPQALANPYTRTVTLGNSFIDQPYLQGVISDTHFQQRDRMGRTVTFMARMIQDGLVDEVSRGIACNEQTAVLISDSGQALVVTQNDIGIAYFLRSQIPPAVCRAGQPLTFTDIEVHALKNGDRFDFTSWTSINGRYYTLSARTGQLSTIGNNGMIY